MLTYLSPVGVCAGRGAPGVECMDASQERLEGLRLRHEVGATVLILVVAIVEAVGVVGGGGRLQSVGRLRTAADS